MTSDTKPEPLVPAEVNLRDFEFMPLDVRRLRDSRLVSIRTPEEALAAILLWSASWHQLPASSLPDDDVELSSLSGYGGARGVKQFKMIREGALHGFILCNDGRWYHPVVAEKAADAWNGRLELEHRRACDVIRKSNKDRRDRNEVELPLPPKPILLSRQEFFGIPCWKRYGSDGVPAESVPSSSGIPASVSAGPGASAPPFERDRDSGEGKGIDKPKGTAFALPDWVPTQAWGDWIAMRKGLKKAPTDKAKAMAVTKLEKLKAQGHDPAAVLDQSTFKSWTDLYEIKDGFTAKPRGPDLQSRNAETARRFAEGGGNARG